MYNFIHYRKQLNQSLFWIIFVLIPIVTICSGYYRYGIGDETITIPFVKHIVNPNLYPGDILIKQQKHYYTYFWHLVAFLYKLGIKLEYVFLGLYLLQIYIFIFSLYLLSRDIGIEKALTVIVFIVALYPKYLPAGMSVTENMLTTRSIALPVLLLSLHFFWKEKIYLSYFLAGVSYLVHPITGVFCAAILLTWSIFATLKTSNIKYICGFWIFLIVVSPMIYWQLNSLSPKELILGVADKKWVNLLKLRSPHHLFISLQSKWVLLNTFFSFIILFLGSTLDTNPIRKKYITILVIISVIMCIAGKILVEIVPIPAVIYLQPWRFIVIISVTASVYVGLILKKTLEVGKYSGFLFGIFVLTVAVFRSSTGFNVCLLYKYLFLVLFVWSLYFITVVVNKNTSSYMRILILLSLFYIFYTNIQGTNFRFTNSSHPEWIDVQLWAKYNTPYNAVFIVPPEREGFRVESERTVYVDWKSGTLLNFDKNYGKIWFNRMQQLGFKSKHTIREQFELLPDSAFTNIASQIPADVYLVDYKRQTPRNFPLVYQNSVFAVYSIKDTEFD